jgi:hypothetical protein
MKWMRMLFTAVLALGLAAPAMAQVVANSETPGSVLVFHKFITGTVAANIPASSFEISVTCPAGRQCPEFTDAVKLKALWVCPSSQRPRDKRICRATDFELRTTVKGTLWFNPENATGALSPNAAPAAAAPSVTPFVPTPPCREGYLIVWVINNLDQPISFNGLIGNAILRFSANDASAYNALPIQAIGAAGTVLNNDPNAALAFDGVQYARVTGNIFGTVRYDSPAGNAIRTDLTLLTLDVRANTPNLVTFVPLVFYNENERPISTFVEFICFTQVRLRELNANLTTNFGGIFAQKGLVESTRTATQQNTNFPFDAFDATLVGIIVTREDNNARSYAYALFHDGVGVTTRFCHVAGVC